WAMSNPNLTFPPLRASRASRLRSFPAFSVDEKVDALVVERDVAGNAFALRQRRTVRPRDVLHQVVAGAGRPVFGLSLVRTPRAVVGRFEQIHANIDLRQVP